MTRSQQYLLDAIDRIGAVKALNDKELSRAYGGLCHKIPMLVLNDGLVQTVAWIDEKAREPIDQNVSILGLAYGLQREHISALFGVQHAAGAPSPLVEAVRDASNTGYMRYTMTLLDASVYYKRFAASILGVKDARSVDEQNEGDTP